MRRATCRSGMSRHWVLAFVVAIVLGAPALWSAEEVTGDWQVTVDFNGRPMVATLSISKKPDGTLAGKWGSSDLSNVKVDGQKLTFVRTIRFGDQEITMNYSGALKDGKLTGTLTGDQGEMPANATRKKLKSPAVGQWEIKFNVMDRDITGVLIISEKPDGALTGQWTKEPGEHAVSNVKFQDGKLTLTRKSKIEDMEFETNYDGTVKGNELVGAWKSDMGEIPANGQRIGAALIGKWELTVTSERGTRTSLMTIDGDLTGTYESFGEIPIKNLKLDGGQVTFAMETSYQDQTFKQDFKGKLDGKTLKGQIVSERGTSEVSGKKLDVAPAAAATPAAAAVPSGLVGKWEMTTTGQDGTPRTSTLTIKADMTGTYTGRNTETPIKDLKVEGNQVSFKYTRSFNDQEFTMEFKGKLDGATLNGEFVSERGNRPVTGKRVN
jgi:hypothetical protein